MHALEYINYKGPEMTKVQDPTYIFVFYSPSTHTKKKKPRQVYEGILAYTLTGGLVKGSIKFCFSEKDCLKVKF